NFGNAGAAPSASHIFGTDQNGRDILSRVFFGFRYSLMLVAVVLSVTVAPGVVLGLVAGYYMNRWFSAVILRLAAILLAVPPLLLALSVASVLTPIGITAMLAVSLAWLPWYNRLLYISTS